MLILNSIKYIIVINKDIVGRIAAADGQAVVSGDRNDTLLPEAGSDVVAKRERGHVLDRTSGEDFAYSIGKF
jgi:hypothetical protein